MVKSALLDTKFADDEESENNDDNDTDESDKLPTSATDNEESKKPNPEGERELTLNIFCSERLS